MGEFDMNKWTRENMLSISFKYNRNFVLRFREACQKLGLKQSDLIRKMMQDTIDEADIVD